jgi:HK97 family phage portal protein
MPSWRFWRRSPTDAYRPLSDPFVAAMLGGGGFGDGPTVNEQTAMGLSAFYRGVSLIAGSIGALPLRTLKTNRDGTRERTTSWLDDPGFGRWTPFEWKELAAVQLILHGGAFGQHVYNGAGSLAGMNWVHPAAVTVENDDNAIGGRRFDVRLDDGEIQSFDDATMTYIPGLSLDGVKGLSVISRARLSLSTAIAGDRAQHRMGTNGAMIAGLVTPDADEDLTEDEAKAVKTTVTAAMTGVENAGQVAVINRKLKFTPWQLSAVDAQFMASRAFSIDEIGRWLGLPPHLLGLVEKSTSWGQGIAEQNRGLARYTLTPWTCRFEQRMTRRLSGRRIAEFDYTAFIAPSPEDEINLLLAQVNGGLITPNEARRIRNLPPMDDGDTLRLPAGMGGPITPPDAPAPPSGGAPTQEKAV